MRRALAAIAATAAGLAALLGYKSGPAPNRLAVPAGSTAPDATGGTTPRPFGNGGQAAGSARSSSSTSAPGSSGSQQTADGPVVPTRFGDIQVEAVEQGGRLVDVVPLALPYDRRRSAFISQQAAPILRREALAAQNARIDIVSGATYTSEGYAESLQAALDSLRQQ